MLAWYRKDKRLTLTQLAGQIGTNVSSLQRIEQGKGMDGETLAKILKWMLRGEHD